MDIKAYIESGVLEAYLLGALSREEERQVQAEITAYPELAAELAIIKETMMQYARHGATEPPAGLQDVIWEALRSNSGANAGGTEPEQRPEARVIPVEPVKRNSVRWSYALAACLAGSIIVNVVLWNQGNESRLAGKALASQIDSLQSKQNKLAELLTDYRKTTAMMADTGMQTIVMHTMQPGHPMAATLYWSKANGEAFVAMNALPTPPQGMQYQLWVIQGGKPVSMGMLPNEMANTPEMQKVAMQVNAGEAFAISLEKEGGNPIPTTVYVLGKV